MQLTPAPEIAVEVGRVVAAWAADAPPVKLALSPSYAYHHLGGGRLQERETADWKRGLVKGFHRVGRRW